MAKIGEGSAAGMLRQGLRELRGAMYTQSNVAQPTDYGIWGNQTPGEVADSRRNDPTKDEEGRHSALVDKHLNRIESLPSQSVSDKEPER